MPNWDSYGARVPSATTLETCKRICAELENPLEINPEVDGSVSLTISGDNFKLEINVRVDDIKWYLEDLAQNSFKEGAFENLEAGLVAVKQWGFLVSHSSGGKL